MPLDNKPFTWSCLHQSLSVLHWRLGESVHQHHAYKALMLPFTARRHVDVCTLLPIDSKFWSNETNDQFCFKFWIIDWLCLYYPTRIMTLLFIYVSAQVKMYDWWIRNLCHYKASPTFVDLAHTLVFPNQAESPELEASLHFNPDLQHVLVCRMQDMCVKYDDSCTCVP